MILLYSKYTVSNTPEMFDLHNTDYIEIDLVKVPKNVRQTKDGDTVYFFIFDTKQKEEAYEFFRYVKKETNLKTKITRVEDIAFVVEIFEFQWTLTSCLSTSAVVAGVGIVIGGICSLAFHSHILPLYQQLL
jgi:hypothetical protein